MYSFGEITTVHLETTTKCNASCPMCARNVLGGKVNPNLPIDDLSLEDAKKIFAPQFIAGLKKMYMCGNYGDPVMGADTLEIFKYFRKNNSEMYLEMFTNGSARPEKWWAELAGVVNRCRFGIDGLADTNAIYRRGTKWDLIIRNLKAFIGAGGKVTWDFIVFKHNEHQVEEARQFAADLGVKYFNVKKTARFFSNSKIEVKNRQEVCDSNGNVEYYLEPPRQSEFQNSALQKEDELIREFGSLKNFFEQTPIDCKVAGEKSIYVTASGHVFPCCWTANQLYLWYMPFEGAPIWQMLSKLPEGLDSLSAKKKGLAGVIEGSFFQKELPESWEKKSTKEGRLFVCGKTCGVGFNSFKAQFSEARA